LPVRVLSRLFRRLFLEQLAEAHAAGWLLFFGALAKLADPDAFAQYLAPSRKVEWVVYSKRPFGGPEAVLAYLSRYTHRVAISNSRLLACDEAGVAFKYKDYRANGRARQKVMRLSTDEFIHSPLPHSCPANRLSSHSPLRPVRKQRPRSKHCSCARAARRGDPAPTRRALQGRHPTRDAHPRASLSMLWRSPNRHRELRTRTRSARLLA
jgi:hypothetical protein